MKSGMILSALAIALTVTACTSVAKVPYDRMSASTIKTIAVPTPSIPAQASVKFAVVPRQKEGMVGFLADGYRESNFRQLTQAHNLSVPATFLSRLTDRLEANGYRVTNVSTPRSGNGFIENYPNTAAADAYLDVVVTDYGYMAAGHNSNAPYRPRFEAKFRLVRGSDSAVLMQDSIIYNPNETRNEPRPGAIPISPNPAYAYPHYSAIISNSDHAVTGLREAALVSADSIANMLR